MEFPHLGQHCSLATCNRLDFLPMKCDSCSQVFCSTHFNYEHHSCPGTKRQDVQVPVCPLCSEPVPTPPGVTPDFTVGQHIDKQCKSDTKTIYTNLCNYKNCKRKELIPVTCSQCGQNYCLRHRHTADHQCKSSAYSNASNAVKSMGEAEKRVLAANAAEYRRTNKPTTLFNTCAKPNLAAARTATTQHSAQTVQSIQGNMSEDEALARALALSIMELDESANRNRRDDVAASAAAQPSNATVPAGVRDAQQGGGKDKCSLS